MSSQRTTRRTLRSLAAMVAIGIAVSACASTSPDDSSAGADTSADAVVGTWGDTAKSKPHLILASDGTVTGTDGCNGISTTFAVDGNSIELEQFASTRMACLGVDPWLSAIHTAVVDGDEMVVSNAKGERIGTLARTAD